jgi:hypothetical protein
MVSVWGELEQMEHLRLMLLCVFSSEGVLSLELKFIYSVDELLTNA